MLIATMLAPVKTSMLKAYRNSGIDVCIMVESYIHQANNDLFKAGNTTVPYQRQKHEIEGQKPTSEENNRD